jgi:DNA-binding MarR family transcriptional regulator
MASGTRGALKMRNAVAAETAASLPPDAAFRDSVADHVARLNVKLKRQLGQFAKETFNLTIVETRIVILLGIYAPCTVNDLAARSDIDRTQISRSIGVLAELNIAQKSPGTTDRREAILVLTGPGRQIHDSILTELYRRNRQLIEGIPASALATFFHVMELLIDRADG